MESPVRIKIGIAILITLIVSTGYSNGLAKEEISKSIAENINVTTNSSTLTEDKSNTVVSNSRYYPNNISGKYQRKDFVTSVRAFKLSDIDNVRNNTSNNTVSSSTTSRTIFRGTAKFQTTKPTFKPKIPHIIMRRNFTRLNKNSDIKNSPQVSETTTQNNEVVAETKFKEVTLNETLIKFKNSNKNDNTDETNIDLIDKDGKTSLDLNSEAKNNYENSKTDLNENIKNGENSKRDVNPISSEGKKDKDNHITDLDDKKGLSDDIKNGDDIKTYIALNDEAKKKLDDNIDSDIKSEQTKDSAINLVSSNRSEGIKSLEQSFNIDKYVSEDFHDINNVYSQSISPEIEHFIVSDNSTYDYFANVNLNADQRKKYPSHEYSASRLVSLTTPRTDYFDRKFKEISESIKQNLADVDMDYANDEISSPDDETSDSNVNFDELLSKPVKENTTLVFRNEAEIVLNASNNNTNRRSDSEKTNETKIVFEASEVSTTTYENISFIKTTTLEPENLKENELTTVSNRNPKSSSSEYREFRVEAPGDRRNDFFKSNFTRKEYLTTVRMRARTTPKPRIRISLKNNRTPFNTTQDFVTTKENLATNKVAEVVKMHPYIKSRATLSTTSSKIDPVAITASEAVDNFVSYLSKRGSTKYSDDNKSTTSNATSDSPSSFSIPPTATAWALIKFKDIPFGKKPMNASESPPLLDNKIKSESEDSNAVNSTLGDHKYKPKTVTPRNKPKFATMEVGESNIEIVTSTSIYTTPTPQSITTSKIYGTIFRTTTETVPNPPDLESTTQLPSVTTIITTTGKSSSASVTKLSLDASESNEVLKNDHLTTQGSNTTSTVGTESIVEIATKTESLTTTTESVSFLTSTDETTIVLDPESSTASSEYTSTYSSISPALDSEDSSTTEKTEIDDNTELFQSTKSFIYEFSTTMTPENQESNITTDIIMDSIKTTTLSGDELDDFNFSSMLSKTESSIEASGDVDETTLQNIDFVSDRFKDRTTMSQVTSDTTKHTTTMSSKLTTPISEKPTARLVTTLTTSLLPLAEDALDSREGKNKVISEEEDKAGNDDDWIDPELPNDTKNIDSNEIPLPPVNKTDIDIIDLEDNNNADNEIPKFVRNYSTFATTTRSNIEIIESNVPQTIHRPNEGSGETTTMFTEDGDDEVYDAVSSSGAIAAITISAIGIVALLLLIGILLVARGRRQGGGYGQRCTPVSLDSYSLDNVSVNGSSRRKGRRSSKRSYGNPAYDEAGAISHPMQFAALANFALDQESAMNEFNDIPVIHARPEEVPPGCESKNRFSNVIPLPETRVSLKLLPGDETSDYINANYVRGPKCLKKYYIACQAPMAATVNDFWRMVWEQNSRVILMLTEFMENGAEKCYEYIPPSEVTDSRRTFGDYQIIIKKRDIRDKYVISQLQLKNLTSKTWREVTHMWYFWPAKGVPDECHSIITFLLEARSYLKASQNSKEFDEDGHDSLVTHNGSYANNVDVTENEDGNDMNIYNVQRGEKSNNGSSKTGTLTHSDGAKRGGPMVVHCSPGTGRTGTVITCDIGIRDFEMSRTVDVPKTVYRVRRDRANCVQTKDQYVFIYKVLSEYATKLTGGVLDSI